MNLFEITIQRKIKEGWPITALRYQSGDLLPVRSEGLFQIDLELLDSVKYLPEDYGSMLGRNVFQGDIERAFDKALTDAKGANTQLRVLLYVEADDLRDLHWERLCSHSDGIWDFLSLNQQTPYSLYLPSLIDRRFPPLSRHHLRAIILIAGPEDLKGNYSLTPFDIEAAARNVSNALGKIPHNLLANLPGAIGKPDLNTLCEQIAINRYTILHIECHGTYHPENKDTILFFPDENGLPVTTSGLIKRLKRLSPLPHFTFLSSCESALPDAETGLGGAAQRLVRELGMPAVLAMAEKISIETTKELTSLFYTRLFEHGEVDLAVADALTAIQHEEDITTPVLFSRLGNRPLFCDTTAYVPNQQEVQAGLNRLKDELAIRAPILMGEFNEVAFETPDTGIYDDKTIQKIITKANEYCGEIFDNLSFTQLATGEKVPPYDHRCPFPGIGPFKSEDKDFFFGREKLVDGILKKIKQDPFLAITGPSGSGKSSLLLAGLIPQLEAHPIYLIPGRDPLKAMENSLSGELSPKSIIIVDQFEELFTSSIDHEKRSLFIEGLLEQNKYNKVIVAMRSDFLGECAQFDALKSKIENGLILVSPIDVQILPQIAQRQADVVKLHFDDGLFSKIIGEVIEEPGAMSLLQHALWCLWERRRGRWLRFSEYNAFGGIKKAIAHTADEFYGSLGKIEQQIVRGIFLRLVRPDDTIGSGPRDTRRRTTIDELIPREANRSKIIEIVRNLANMRLVVTSVDEKTGAEIVDLAHEALIQHWPRLKEWLNEDRENLRLRETIRIAALEWEQGRQDESLLVHRGGRLDDANTLLKQTKLALNAKEVLYIHACLTYREKEQREIERRRKRVIFGLSIALLITISLTLFAFFQRAEMQIQKQSALDRLLLTQTQLLDIRESKNAIPRLGLSIEAFDRLRSVESYVSLWSSLYLFRPKTIYLEADGPVKDICFLPDGKTLVSITEKSIYAWEVKTGDQYIYIDLGDSHLRDNPYVKIICNSDGETVAAIHDRTVSIWDIATGSKIIEMLHGNTVTDFSISPDSKSLVAGSVSGELSLWDVASGQLSQVNLTVSGVQRVFFSPDGAQVVSAHIDGNVRVWNLVTNEVYAIESGTNDVLLACSPDNQWWAMGGKSGNIIIWETQSREKHKIISHREAITTLAFSPNGDLLLSASIDSTSKIWSVPSFREVAGINTFGHIKSANFNSHYPYVVIGGFSGYALVLEQGQKDQMGKYAYYGIISAPLEGQITKTIFSPNGEIFAAASVNGDIVISPVTTNYLHHDSQVWHIEFNTNDDLLITSSRDGTAKIWDTYTGRKKIELNHLDLVNYATFDTDGRYAATASSDDTAVLWNVSDGSKVFTIAHNNDVIDVKFSPDGELVASGGLDGVVQIWEIETKVKVFEVVHPKKINRLLFSPNNKWIITASNDRSIVITDLNKQNKVLNIALEAAVTDMGITPSSDFIISGDVSGTVTVWNVLDGRKTFSEKIDTSAINKIAINPDGTLFAAGSNTGKVYVWQLLDGKKVLNFSAGKAVWDIVFSGSDYVIAASADTFVHIWDLNSKLEYGRMNHEGLVLSLDLSKDDNVLAISTTAGISKYVVWRREDIIHEACSRIPRQLTESEWIKYFGEEEYDPFCNHFEPNE